MRGGPALVVDIFGLEHLFQQADLVVGVENGEVGLEPDQFGVAAQDFGGDGVKGAEPAHALGAGTDQRGDALLHLARRLVGEGDGEDFMRPGAAHAPEYGRCARSDTRVLPVPAPASTSTGPSSASTASRCSGLSAVEPIGRATRGGLRPRGQAAGARAGMNEIFVTEGERIGQFFGQPQGNEKRIVSQCGATLRSCRIRFAST